MGMGEKSEDEIVFMQKVKDKKYFFRILEAFYSIIKI